MSDLSLQIHQLLFWILGAIFGCNATLSVYYWRRSKTKNKSEVIWGPSERNIELRKQRMRNETHKNGVSVNEVRKNSYDNWLDDERGY